MKLTALEPSVVRPVGSRLIGFNSDRVQSSLQLLLGDF